MNGKSMFAIVAAMGLSAAMAAPAFHHTRSIDGSTPIKCNTSTMLFGGATPPNGFMVQVPTAYGATLYINDTTVF
jgi:hypothetical protein